MQPTDDSVLLREYAENHSDEAFAALISRHLNLVYSVAWRCVGDAHQAEEVAQAVFVLLAKKAAQLRHDKALSSWLFQATRLTASNFIRGETRRHRREQEAHMRSVLNDPGNDLWQRIAPLLDDAVAGLGEKDRQAIVLRFYEGRNLREVGAALGASEDAAEKRVSRAIERLRDFFAKRGVTVGASGLALLLSANAVQAAPIGLAVTISTATAAVAGTTLVATGAGTGPATAVGAVTKAIAMTTLQKVAITATLAVVAGAGIYQKHQASRWREQHQALQRQQPPFAEQIQQLTRERDETIQQLAMLRDENARLNLDTSELLKLRGEVSQLRRAQADAAIAPNRIVPPGPPPAGAAQAQAQVEAQAQAGAVEAGRELGRAVVRGDPGALAKVTELSKTALAALAANRSGTVDPQRNESSALPLASVQAAFDVIGEAAASGNPVAIAAVESALQIPELKGHAVKIVGTLAGKGNEAALEMLLNPDKYGILLSSSVFALRSAAEAGNPKAIDALAAVSRDEKKQALWLAAAHGLATAAESGNEVAVDGLVAMSVSTNRSVRDAVVSGLKRASANQNAKATEILRSMGVP